MYKKIRQLVKEHTNYNVIGVSEEDTYVEFFVQEKLDEEELVNRIEDHTQTEWSEKDFLPKEIKTGWFKKKPVKVTEVGEVKIEADRNKYRPLLGGSEIRSENHPGVGTLGAFVEYKEFYGRPLVPNTGFNKIIKMLGYQTETKTALLTNSHVANPSVLNPTNPRFKQPGIWNVKYIGEFFYSEPMFDDRDNEFDTSLGKTHKDKNKEIIRVGKITGHRNPDKGERVHKYGRTTGYTRGFHKQSGVTMKINYGGEDGALWFDDLELFSNMSTNGDSGSVIVSVDDNNAVSLLFAGSSTTTIGIPIEKICNRLGITFPND